MRDIALDPVSGDLLVDSGSTRLTSSNSPEAVGQRMRLRLSLWRGEYGLNTGEGIPYTDLLGQKNTIDRTRRVLRRAASTCPGLGSLDSFSLAVDAARTATVSLTGRTTGGEPVSIDSFVVGSF